MSAQEGGGRLTGHAPAAGDAHAVAVVNVLRGDFAQVVQHVEGDRPLGGVAVGALAGGVQDQRAGKAIDREAGLAVGQRTGRGDQRAGLRGHQAVLPVVAHLRHAERVGRGRGTAGEIDAFGDVAVPDPSIIVHAGGGFHQPARGRADPGGGRPAQAVVVGLRDRARRVLGPVESSEVVVHVFAGVGVAGGGKGRTIRYTY